VIRSIKRVESSPRITAEERKSTSGVVATIPFGGKATVGTSTDMRREQQMPVVTYEVVVRLDDGRFQVVVQEDAGAMREGDKVKVERGKVVPRDQ
jgi:outer membrane lipoprotein SlyB